MGIQDVSDRTSPDELRHFIRSLLKDLRALDKMIAGGLIQSGVRRIGAEQELVIINPAFRPAPIAQKLLDGLADPHFTNEIALFNIELNLDPFTFAGDCLSSMERQLDESIARARAVASAHDADIALV